MRRRPARLLAATLLGVSLLHAGVWVGAAQEGARQEPPPPGPMRPFEFPAYATRTLPNGLTVFVIEDRRQPLVSFALLVNAGAVGHAVSRAGLASMTAQLLRQGTSTRTAQEIAAAIDGVGGSLSASADHDTVQVSATAVKSAADLALELLADVVLRPTFEQAELDRVLQQRLSSLQIQYTDPEYLVSAAAGRATFGAHPYGLPVEGTPDTLRAIAREDIVEFHRRQYSPAGASLAISGDVTPDEAMAQVRKHFGAWATAAPGSPDLPAVPEPAPGVVMIDKPDAVQTQIVAVAPSIPRNHPDYFPLLLANQAFGAGFNSRLNMTLRAKEGLTYDARSSLDTRRAAGMFEVSTFTRTEATGRTLELLAELLREFRRNPITEAELVEAKAFLVGSFALATETPGQVAARVLAAAKYGLPADYWNTYRERIQAVTAEEVAGAVRRQPDRLRLVAVGNAKAFAPALEAFGPVETIPFADLDLVRPDMRRAQ